MIRKEEEEEEKEEEEEAWIRKNLNVIYLN